MYEGKNQKNIDEFVVFFIGSTECCFAFTTTNKVIRVANSLDAVITELSKDYFLRINYYTLINVKFFISKNGKREIKMQGGSIHKVSRKRWNDFK